MNTQHNKNPLKKLISLAGVAGASVFLGLPGFAEMTPNAGGVNQPVNNSDVQTEQLLAQSTLRNERDNFICEGYLGNPTTGGGYFCSMQYRQFSNRELSTQYGTPRMERGNEARTTGAGYPGNNVTPQGQDDTMNRDSMNRGTNFPNETPRRDSSFRDNGGSTTGAGFPGNNVTPQGGNNR